ncbi:MAG: hypothetical protein ABI688_06510 [Bacteroidota bacterium]
MRKLFVITTFVFLALVCRGQQTAFNLELNTGFLSFHGQSSVKTSFINQSDVTSVPNYTNSIYGRDAGTGFGIGISVQRVTKSRIIFGLATGAELLKCKVEIDGVAGRGGGSPANGSTTLTSKFINIRPLAGYRFKLNKKLTADIMANLEFAFCIATHEKGSATTPLDAIITTDSDRENTGLDFRTGGQIKLNYSRYSFLAGYWRGHSNYYEGIIGGSPEAYSTLVRLGLAWRLNK